MIEKINPNKWNQYVKDTDIFYQKEYLDAYKGGSKEFQEAFSGQPMLLYYEDKGGSIVHPVFRQGNKISSPYGYSGPAIVGNPSLPSYFIELEKFCREEGIEEEFVRHHPWLVTASQNKAPVGNIAYINLAQPIKNILAAMSKKCRNAIHKAEKTPSMGLRQGFNNAEVLYNHYSATMKRNNANPKYLFPLEFFARLPNARFFVAWIKGEDVASAVFLHYKQYCHYFLAGSTDKARGTNAANLIIWEAIKYYRDQGCVLINLGGTIGHDIGLRKFKQSFTNLSKEFCIENRVYK